MKMTTLCYIEKDGCYLMLHRTKKEKDINKGKWIGVGGHAYDGETPEECLLREVKEETQCDSKYGIRTSSGYRYMYRWKEKTNHMS